MDKLSNEDVAVVLKTLDDLLTKSPWAASDFLGAIAKKIQVLRDDFAKRAEAPTTIVNPAHEMVFDAAGQATRREIFVALYSSTGANLQSWEQILASLPNQIISRPVYSTEIDVQERMRASLNPTNEAYAVVLVDLVIIIAEPPEKARKDKYGKPLLSIREKAISMNQIIRFVHRNESYLLKDGHLVRG